MFLSRRGSFRGGVHPESHKRGTMGLPVEDMPAPPVLVFPLQQHPGRPAGAVVKKGDRVRLGQLIAGASEGVSANIHSSVSGRVTAVEPRLHAGGYEVLSVVIENDGRDEKSPDIPPPRRFEALTPGEIAAAAKDAGIVGMGGAAFPTHIKLSPPPGKRIEYLIANGAECEPYLTSDYRVMLEDTELFVDGCRAAAAAVGAARCIIAVEDDKPDAAARLREHIDGIGCGVYVEELRTKYPQGSEKQIISAITGREVPPGGLPADVGAIVLNVDTCTSIARAITTGIPLISRVVTVDGGAVERSRNYRVRLGTPVRELLAFAGLREEPAKLLLGGPMMGKAVFSQDIPLIKGTGAVIAFGREDIFELNKSNCVRCGKCVRACPVNLVPAMLDRYGADFDIHMITRYNIADCIECGACTYICPARRDPLQSIRTAKHRLAERRAANV